MNRHADFNFMRRQINPPSPSKLRIHARYLAGLMDGEGTFAIYNRKDTLEFTPCISLTMTHEPTIEFVKEIFGVTHEFREPKSKLHKTAYNLRVNTIENCLTICTALFEYSITKKEPIKLLWEFSKLSTSIPPQGPERKEVLLKIVELYVACRKANLRGRAPNYEAMKKRLQRLVAKEP